MGMGGRGYTQSRMEVGWMDGCQDEGIRCHVDQEIHNGWSKTRWVGFSVYIYSGVYL